MNNKIIINNDNDNNNYNNDNNNNNDNNDNNNDNNNNDNNNNVNSILLNKYLTCIRDVNFLNKEMINNINNMSNEDKIKIIIAFNDVVEVLYYIILKL
jgi:hypothetical protein